MIEQARYVHTNVIARDWRRLAHFYERLFGCTPVPPQRDLSGPEFEAGCGVPGAKVQGIQLRMPGCAEDGPTLEIFQYSEPATETARAVNRPGFAHLAFTVPSVPEARSQVLSLGGSAIGEIVNIQIAAGRNVTWCYVADPEGNILELQSWSGQ